MSLGAGTHVTNIITGAASLLYSMNHLYPVRSSICAAESQQTTAFLVRFDDKNRSDEEEVEYEAGVVDSLFNPRAWMKYLNPVEWFRGGMSTTEGVIMSIVILVFLVLGLVLAKICSCFSCCITIIRKLCCCPNKDRSRKVEIQKPLVMQMEELDGQVLSKI
jgi:hypothetical protein